MLIVIMMQTAEESSVDFMFVQRNRTTNIAK